MASFEKKRGKDVEIQTRKILLLKMLQFIVARWSHPRRIAVAFREVYLHFAKQNACRVPFSPSLSFSPLFTRGSHPLCPFRVLSSTGTESEQEERAFISSLLTAMRRKHARIFFSRSLFFSFTLPQISILSLFPWLWISAVDN